MFLSSKMLDDIKAGELIIDCPSMDLVPVVEGSRKRYKGSGQIALNTTGISFKFFTVDEIDIAEFFKESSAKAGQLFEDADFYWLYATDVQGDSWRSSRLLPDFTSGVGTVATGKLSEVISSRKHRLSMDQPHLDLWFVGDLRFPLNQATLSQKKVGEEIISRSGAIDCARFSISGYEFSARHEEGWSTLAVTPDSATLPEFIVSRIEESLEFMLARPVRALVIQEVDASGINIVIKADGLRSGKSCKPPLTFSSSVYRREGWRFFERFFAHVEPHGGGSMPAISRIMQYVVQLNDAVLDARALSLGVAVEGILTELFPALAESSPEFLSELDVAVDAIKQLSLSPFATSRIVGSLGVMKKARAKDRLRALVSDGVITQGHYAAWEKLRNSTAHAAVHSLDNKFLNLCDKVLVLLYCLVFHVIGYVGPFTDYGVPGWPQADYPLVNLESPVSESS